MQFQDGLSDDELYAAFESGRLPKEAFHHREHIRAAFLYLSRIPTWLKQRCISARRYAVSPRRMASRACSTRR
jgi:hypothetical protein